MDKPFSTIVFSTIIGILLANYFTLDIKGLIFLVGFILLLFIFNIFKNKSNTINILVLFSALAMIVTSINKNNTIKDYLDTRSDFEGIVHDVLFVDSETSKYIVVLNKVDNREIDQKLMLKVIGEKSFELGDMISFYGELKLPMRNTNPKLYNYKLSLLSDKIHTTMTIKDFSIHLLERRPSIKYKVRSSFEKDVSDLFNLYLNEKNAPLIPSIILGKSSLLEEEDLLKYRELGLAHILAVSGLHIGIISSFLIFVISRMGVNRKINIVLSLSIIWIYGFLIGFPPSTLRASIMFTILIYSSLIHEPYDSINTIMVSMLISLFINPFWLFDIGFQLSYMATLSIVVLTPNIIKMFYPFKNKIIMAVASILSVNMGLLPIQSYYFNRIPILGLFANLVTIPLLSLSLVLGISMIAFNYTFSFLNIGLGALLNSILNLQYIIVEILHRIPIDSIKVFSPDMLFCLLYFIVLGIAFNIINFNYYRTGVKRAILYYLLILVSWNVIIISMDQRIEIDFIDVGQGDSILIKTQDSSYLMDTGGSLMSSFDIGQNITLPYIEKLGLMSLDGVIITHFDEDHYQGLYALMKEIEIKNIYASYIPDNINLLNEISSKNIPITVLKENDLIRLDKNTTLRVIWPFFNGDKDRYISNDKSLVSKLSYKSFNILFTGDIEKDVEAKILDKLDDDINILKVPHHGSATSSSIDFLNSILPEYSIISVGRYNRYNHPNKEVIERLESLHSTIYRTDEMGMVRVSLDNEMIVSSYLEGRNQENTFINFILNNNIEISIYALYFLIGYMLTKQYTDCEKEGVLIELY